jgi:hypothetical protein
MIKCHHPSLATAPAYSSITLFSVLPNEKYRFFSAALPNSQPRGHYFTPFAVSGEKGMGTG